jgi:hypothetical protein
MPALKKMVFLFIMVSIDGLLYRPTAGGSAAWPLPLCGYHFSRKSTIAIRCSLFELWPKPAPVPALAKRGEQNCSPLFLEQFWLRLPRALCGEAGARPPSDEHR